MPDTVTRRTVLQKVRGRAYIALPQLVNTGFQVLFHSPPGVLFTFPSQYYPLSVTKEYLALRGGPRSFPLGFPCLVVLWILLALIRLRLRGSHPLWQAFPGLSAAFFAAMMQSEPRSARTPVWALPVPLAATPGIILYFLFLRLLRCFSSPGSLRTPMDSVYGGRALPGRVSPFRYPWITACLRLPMAFRSLPRLSSALSAKASTLCSFRLTSSLPFHGSGYAPSVALWSTVILLLSGVLALSASSPASDVSFYLVLANFD